MEYHKFEDCKFIHTTNSKGKGVLMANKKSPAERMQEEQARHQEHLEAVAAGKARLTEDTLEFWLPSGVTAKVPKHEVLILRNLCDDWMSVHGAWDVMGRAVKLQTSDTAPSGTEPQDGA